ncbi:CRISPR-associated endonuclease Cas2 [Peptoanaerobacter stomatis]
MLCAFGYRIQKSAFECILTKEKCELLLKKNRQICKRRRPYKNI